MRTSIRAAILAASLLLVVGAAGFVAAAGARPTAGAQTQAVPSGMPQPGGQMGDPSTMLSAAAGRPRRERHHHERAADRGRGRPARRAMPGGAGGAGHGCAAVAGSAAVARHAAPGSRRRCSRRRSRPSSRTAPSRRAQQEAIQEALTQGMPAAPGGATVLACREHVTDARACRRGRPQAAARPGPRRAPRAPSALDQLDPVAVGVGDEGDLRPGALEQVGLAHHRPAGRREPAASPSMSSTSKAKWPNRSPPS